MNQLIELREKKNLTQAQAADVLGISLRTYNSWENEAYEVPHLTLIGALSVLRRARKRK